jgi:hypothetical protein
MAEVVAESVSSFVEATPAAGNHLNRGVDAAVEAILLSVDRPIPSRRSWSLLGRFWAFRWMPPGLRRRSSV